MPKVEQYDWSKLTPQTPDQSKRGTKEFAQYKFIEAHKKSKNGAIKVTKLPKKPKDYHTGNAISHLKSIMREQ